MTKTITRIGCFKIGSKIVIGNGRSIKEIAGFRVGTGHNLGQVLVEIKGGVTRDIRTISLAGPNGDGVGA